MIYNSNRIMNNFIAESFYNEGNRMINNILVFILKHQLANYP